MWRLFGGIGSSLLLLTLLSFITLAPAHNNQTVERSCSYGEERVKHGSMVREFEACCLKLVCCHGSILSLCHRDQNILPDNKDHCVQDKNPYHPGCCCRLM